MYTPYIKLNYIGISVDVKSTQSIKQWEQYGSCIDWAVNPIHGNVYANKIKPQSCSESYIVILRLYSPRLIELACSVIIHSSKVLAFFNWIFNRQEHGVHNSQEKKVYCVLKPAKWRGVYQEG